MIDSIFLVIIATLFTAYGVYLLKKATFDNQFKFRYFFRNKIILAGLGIHGISSLIFIYALRNSQLSILYPIFALNYIWVALLSWKLLDERINLYKVIGIVLIIIGIISLTI